MGAYSEMDLDMQFGSDNPSSAIVRCPRQFQAVSQNQQVSGSVAPTRPKPPQADEAKEKAADEDAAKRKADEDARRRAHEESEAKRKAEWEARQQLKRPLSRSSWISWLL